MDHTWRYIRSWLTFRPWQRHSLVLMISGLAYVMIGLTYILITELSAARSESLVVALNMFPLDVWGMIFVLSGGLACLSSRWPSFSETWGYMVLTGLSSAWSAMYLTTYILTDAPYRNLISSLIWALAAFMWWAISGLLNPDGREVMDGPD